MFIKKLIKAKEITYVVSWVFMLCTNIKINSKKINKRKKKSVYDNKMK